MNIGIYKITSPIGRIYIGQSINLKLRMYQYSKSISKSQSRLYNSIIKHGWDKHKFEVIKNCSAEELDEFEIYYIDEYKSFNTDNGLNLTAGGKSGYKISDSTIKKMSNPRGRNKNPMSQSQKDNIRKALIGKKRPKEVKDKISQTRSKRIYVINDDLREKMRVNAIGNSAHCKKVVVVINNVKEYYNSILDASINMNYTRQYLSMILNNKKVTKKFKISYL